MTDHRDGGADGLAALGAETLTPAPIGTKLRRDKVFENLFGRSDATPVKIGRFTLLECVGAGGMGELYAAYDAQLDRKVAIKLVRPDKRGGADAGQRLVREAQAAARLSHPNVVHVYESGVFEGRVYVAMEFVRGVDLREWLLAGPREDAEILARFIEAGRGLAAVHAAGLAHRDFKPANTLLGDDDRVRIVDFGLARHVGDPDPDPDPGPALTDDGKLDEERTTTIEPAPSRTREPTGDLKALATLTVPGTIMGTPRYMAPEQWQGARGDARSDQFSFCVAVYEALFGVPPFPGPDTERLLEAIAARRITPPKRATKLPRALREALMRGLDPEPTQRWPSMDALLDELERPLVASKRRGVWFGLVATVAAGVGLGLATLLDDQPRCTIDEQALAEIWSPTRKTELERAFAATGSSFASQSSKTVGDRLDAWVQGFVASRREACEATWVEGVQSQALLDLRTACLDRKREAFEVVVETFVAADDEVVVHARELLAELPDLGECSNPVALQSGDPMPTEPGAAARVLDAYASLARARVLEQRGQAERARTIASALVVDDYAPVAIEAKALRARLIARTTLEPGLLGLRAAANEAEHRGLLELEASIRVELAREAVGDWSKPELEAWLIDDAEQLLSRLAQPDDPRHLQLLSARARQREQLSDYAGTRALLEQGIELAGDDTKAVGLYMELANLERKLAHYDEARRLYLDVLTRLRERWGRQHPMLASVHYNLGVLALDRGDFDDARLWLREARARFIAAQGPRTVDVAEVDFALAKLALSSGEFELARAQITELLPIFEAELGPEHESTARAHAALGVVRFYMGDLEGSLESYRRALPTFERVLGLDNDEVALMHANIGESLLGLGRPVEAAQACDRAIELLERVLPPTHPYLGVPYKVRGVARLDSGRVAAAIADLERAVTLLSSQGAEPLELADAQFALARALLEDPDSARAAHDRATQLGDQAAAGFVELGLDDRIAEVERWRASSASTTK